MRIQRIFFDFGGCLDAPGIHTRTLFWDAFLAGSLLSTAQRDSFQGAYTDADRRMMRTGEAKELGLSAFNRWNAGLIAAALGIDRDASTAAADLVTERMRACLQDSGMALSALAPAFRLSVISNFTGNLELILREHELLGFFDSVTESYHAGFSKPDLRIFAAAIARHAEPAGECLYVGDNPVNDIEPARKLGWRTALIHQPGQRRECGADLYLESLFELAGRIQSR